MSATPLRAPPSAIRLAPRSQATLVPFVARACLWLGVMLAALSFGDGPPWLLALAGLPIGLGIILGDVHIARRGAITPITVFAVTSALTAFANTTGLLAANTSMRSGYFTYAAENYLLLASQLSIVG